MATTILITLILFALCGVASMAAACHLRARDGSMTGRHELITDIEQDAGGNPFRRQQG